LLSDTHAFGERYTLSRYGQERGERFQAFSYYCSGAITDLPASLQGELHFDPGEVAAYEIATATPLEPPNVRAPEYLRRLLERCKVAVWQDWTAIALRDGVAFVSHTGKSGALGKNVEHDYFPLYLYCLHQKTALLDLQDQLLTREPNRQRALKSLVELFEHFIGFRNRFWFVEVTRRPLGMELITFCKDMTSILARL